MYSRSDCLVLPFWPCSSNQLRNHQDELILPEIQKEFFYQMWRAECQNQMQGLQIRNRRPNKWTRTSELIPASNWWKILWYSCALQLLQWPEKWKVNQEPFFDSRGKEHFWIQKPTAGVQSIPYPFWGCDRPITPYYWVPKKLQSGL